MEKPKRKIKRRSLWERIEGRREFEYVSQQAIEDCVQLLEKGTGGEKDAFRLPLVVRSASAGRYRLSIYTGNGRNPGADIIGYLEPIAGGTRIYGYARINPVMTGISVILGIAFAGFAISISSVRNPVVTIVSAGMIVLLLVFIFQFAGLRERDRQITVLEETLLMPEEKPKHTAGEIVEST